MSAKPSLRQARVGPADFLRVASQSYTYRASAPARSRKLRLHDETASASSNSQGSRINTWPGRRCAVYSVMFRHGIAQYDGSPLT